MIAENNYTGIISDANNKEHDKGKPKRKNNKDS